MKLKSLPGKEIVSQGAGYKKLTHFTEFIRVAKASELFYVEQNSIGTYPGRLTTQYISIDV